ncbi:MAG: PAS-domain containing protein [Acetobacteraceae bacterium]|nr:PAS-domain containing protein [Acetobacteraceae bacterium]
MLNSLHKGNRTSLGSWLLVALVVTVLWGGIGFNLWRDYGAAQRDAVDDTTNLARAFAENITRTVEAVDQTLLFVREAYRRDHSALDIAALTQGRSFLNDLRVQISVTDRTGKVLWSNLGLEGGDVDLSDREHFRVQMRSTDDALYISNPVVGRISNKTSIQFVRRITAPDGSFDGIVVVSLDPDYLSNFYRSIQIGSGSIMLMNADGTVLARAPDTGRVIGGRLPVAVRSRLLQEGPSGTVRTVSAIDGVERIYSFRQLDRYPLTVKLGVATHDVFAAYERNKRLYFATGFLLSVASLAVGWVMQRQRRSLLDSRQALAATLENMSQGIMMVDVDGRIPVINRRAVELLGLPASLIASRLRFRDILDWQLVNQEFGQPETWDDGLAPLLRGGGIAEGNHVYERRRPNGTVLEVRTRSLPDRGAVRTFTDITERKRNENALAEAQARAAHAERMQALGQLAGGIAHDFNNILQIVQGGASLIEKRASDAEGAQRLARMIVDATERGTSITRRLLSFARRGELRAEPIEPASLLEELRDVLIHTLGSPIEVRLTLEPALPSVLADKGQLETALVNLATNARDAMVQGGTLTFAAEVETVAGPERHAADLRPGRYVHLAIGDTGAGMDKPTLARVLEPFFTTKPPGQGTGLGLPMAKGFAEQSGGGLIIDSVPGTGTTVHLWLPAVDRAVPLPSHAGSACHHVLSGSRRVLLVDDEPLVLESLAWALQDAGYAVLLAAGGAEALSLLDAGEPVDVLVTDLAMPGINGLTVIQEAQRGRHGLPAVLLTGYAGEGAQLAVGDALTGAFALLRNPVTGAQLADRIEALLAVAPIA